MSFENLRVSVKEGIALIEIDRPQALNALNQATLDELDLCLKELEQDPEARALLFGGRGDRAFAAGADIGELASLSAVEARAFARRGQGVLRKIGNSRMPSLAAVHGFCLGGGCELALACDLRIASEDAVFGQPEVKLGLIPGFGGTQRLPRLVGTARALELLMTGERIEARQALEWGLVNRVTSKETLLSESRELVGRILNNAPRAVEYARRALRAGQGMSLEEATDHEAVLFGLCFATEDAGEGTRAFLEKRNPSFQGK